MSPSESATSPVLSCVPGVKTTASATVDYHQKLTSTQRTAVNVPCHHSAVTCMKLGRVDQTDQPPDYMEADSRWHCHAVVCTTLACHQPTTTEHHPAVTSTQINTDNNNIHKTWRWRGLRSTERPKFVFVFSIENDVLCRFRQFRLRPKMIFFFIFVFFVFGQNGLYSAVSFGQQLCSHVCEGRWHKPYQRITKCHSENTRACLSCCNLNGRRRHRQDGRIYRVDGVQPDLWSHKNRRRADVNQTMVPDQTTGSW